MRRLALALVLTLAWAALACAKERGETRDHRGLEASPPEVGSPGGPPPTVDSGGAAPASPFAGKLGGVHGPTELLPARVGASRSTIEGCLAARDEHEARRFPAPAPTRSAGPEVQVSLVPGGLVVTHALAHACCLSGTVSSSVEGDALTVTEALQGSPCRCMCGSTLRTAVRLARGRYRLTVLLRHDDAPYRGKVERLLERTMEVR